MSTVDELRASHEDQKERLGSVIDELIEVIVSDINPFLEREMRKVFVASGDFGAGFDDDKVLEIKKKLADQAEELGDKLKAKLGEQSLWIGEEVPSAEGKTLERNEMVWAELQSLSTTVVDTAKEIGFEEPDEGWDIIYRTPTYFIDGVYAPGLIEKYWTQLQVMRQLEEEINEAEKELQKEQLAERWDRIEP